MPNKQKKHSAIIWKRTPPAEAWASVALAGDWALVAQSSPKR